MIKAKLLAIKSHENVGCYTFSACGSELFMLALGPLENLCEGANVWLNFKSSDVIISLARLEKCSLKNELACQITDISKGKIASVVHLKFGEYELESIISSDSCERLNLAIGDDIFAYIKSTSLHISQIDD